jgi:hypothetical protein
MMIAHIDTRYTHSVSTGHRAAKYRNKEKVAY